MEGTRLHVSRFWDAENSLVTDSPIQSGVRNRAVRVGPVLGEPTRGRAGAPTRTGTPSVRARVAVAATEHRRTFVTTVEVSWKCRERCRVCFDLTLKKTRPTISRRRATSTWPPLRCRAWRSPPTPPPWVPSSTSRCVYASLHGHSLVVPPLLGLEKSSPKKRKKRLTPLTSLLFNSRSTTRALRRSQTHGG